MEKKAEQNTAVQKSDVLEFVKAIPEDPVKRMQVMAYMQGMEAAKFAQPDVPDRDGEKS